jgi:hypothetical protein
MTTINTKLRRFTTTLRYSATALVLVTVCASRIVAQEGHSHTGKAQQQENTADDQNSAATLLKVVRQATEKFKDVEVAKAAGYALQFGCVTGSDSGAMGLHYVNGDLVNKGVLDPTQPQIIIYEPMPDGSLRLTGADFLVLAATWNATHSGPPQLMGQLFHLFDSPNRFALPAFYTLHVWAWKHNPNGAFVNWHPQVSCQSFSAQ